MCGKEIIMTFFPNLLPKLRFPEFERNWEVKKLGDICKMQAGKFVSASEILKETNNKLYPCYGANGLRGFTYSYNYDGEYSLIGRQGALCGNITRVYDKFYATEHAVVVTPKDKVHSNWLFYLLNYLNLNQYATGMAQPGLSVQNLLEVESIITDSIEEQKKIASSLSLIDIRISTQKKIIEDLIILKSSTAQNIFNQVFRFKDSEDNDFPKWDIKKLGDVCEIKRGASPRPISDSKWFDEDSKIGWVRISDVTKSNKYLEKTEQYLSNAGISKSRLVKKGNMIMSICATIGKPIYTNFDVCIHDGFVVFENLTLDKEFLYYYLDFIQLNWYKYGQPGIQINLNSEIVNNESVLVPVIEEQIKIAEFLSKFDEKINLENELLTQYENQKKYFLHNLFV